MQWRTHADQQHTHLVLKTTNSHAYIDALTLFSRYFFLHSWFQFVLGYLHIFIVWCIFTSVNLMRSIQRHWAQRSASFATTIHHVRGNPSTNKNLNAILIRFQQRRNGQILEAVLLKRKLLELLGLRVQLQLGREVEVLKQSSVILLAAGPRTLDLLRVWIHQLEPTLNVGDLLISERLREIGRIRDTRWIRRDLRAERWSEFASFQFLPINSRKEWMGLHIVTEKRSDKPLHNNNNKRALKRKTYKDLAIARWTRAQSLLWIAVEKSLDQISCIRRQVVRNHQVSTKDVVEQLLLVVRVKRRKSSEQLKQQSSNGIPIQCEPVPVRKQQR